MSSVFNLKNNLTCLSLDIRKMRLIELVYKNKGTQHSKNIRRSRNFLSSFRENATIH